MKFVVLISVLLTSTPSVWAAAPYAAGMVLKVDLQHKTTLLSCECIPGDMPAGMAWPDEAELLHSLYIVVLDRDGRLAANIEGNQFTAQQLSDLIEVILKQQLS
jgi:hypothetical protein